MDNDIVTLMVVDVPHGRLLAECPPVFGIQPGMVAEMDQVRGVIKKVVQVVRDSDEYELIRSMIGKPWPVTRISSTCYQQCQMAK